MACVSAAKVRPMMNVEPQKNNQSNRFVSSRALTSSSSKVDTSPIKPVTNFTKHHSKVDVESSRSNASVTDFTKNKEVDQKPPPMSILEIVFTKGYMSIIQAIDKDSWSLIQFLKESHCLDKDTNLFSLTTDVTRFLVKEEEKRNEKGRSGSYSLLFNI